MQMTPASELKPLQVRLPGPVLEEFKTYAQEQGQSMASLVLGWVEAALAGTPPTPVSPTSTPATETLGFGDVLAELKLQTALLQQLAHQAAATPDGGTVQQALVKSVPGETASKFTVKPGEFTAAPAAAPKSTSMPVYGLAAMEARGLAPAPPELAPCITKRLGQEADWTLFRPDVACVLTLADGTRRNCTATGTAGGWVQLRLGNHAWLAAPLSAVELEGQQQE
jgi:hypothetical protein